MDPMDSAFVWQTDLKISEIWTITFPTFSPRLKLGSFPKAGGFTRNIGKHLGYCLIKKSFVVREFLTETCNQR